jgi:hypothetical protein
MMMMMMIMMMIIVVLLSHPPPLRHLCRCPSRAGPRWCPQALKMIAMMMMMIIIVISHLLLLSVIGVTVRLVPDSDGVLKPVPQLVEPRPEARALVLSVLRVVHPLKPQQHRPTVLHTEQGVSTLAELASWRGVLVPRVLRDWGGCADGYRKLGPWCLAFSGLCTH